MLTVIVPILPVSPIFAPLMPKAAVPFGASLTLVPSAVSRFRALLSKLPTIPSLPSKRKEAVMAVLEWLVTVMFLVSVDQPFS